MPSIHLFKKLLLLPVLLCIGFFTSVAAPLNTWIRINQLGYTPQGVKVAVLVSKTDGAGANAYFEIFDEATHKRVFKGNVGKNFGAYGPFAASYRLNFSAFAVPGTYYINVGDVTSPKFRVAKNAYAGTADFILRYMRQQRSGYNPFLKDSCHTHDGYTVYGPMADGTFIDVAGGWHDATDYLQYVTTSANATYHLLAAYRDFPSVFKDNFAANGLPCVNGVPDELDEGIWGLQWLLKMHPRPEWMFNQIADDRDHAGMRLPNHDSVNYGFGKGTGRPVYFIDGKPQGLGNYKNRSTGAASTAGKFASAFALGAQIYKGRDAKLASLLAARSLSAYSYGLAMPGVAQTASTLSPYFYEEDNWTDDMELGAAALYQLNHNKKYQTQGLQYSVQEPVTPWLGKDSVRHYQWYPFHNFGHFELAKTASPARKAKLIAYYREGINRVWQRASGNAFYRGVPFIWCSNNLTASFAIQCYLYRTMSHDRTYEPLEQACFDWLFGCNPWGKSMVYGLPQNGDTPTDPHSSFTVLNHYPLDGALVDGPVYARIYNNLRGIKLSRLDAYADFQSDMAVYHDDSGDYSTNEPTMDGSASLIYLLAAKEFEATNSGKGKIGIKKR